MKIKTLNITNFRCHKKTSINFSDHVNWFMGLSGKGKSTIPAAIEMAFSGRNEWTNEAGTGSETQVGEYGETANIEAIMSEGPSGFALKRGVPSPIDRANQLVDREILKICLRCRGIFDLDYKAQKDMFAYLVFGKMNAPFIFSKLNSPELSPEIPNLGDWFKKYLDDNSVHVPEENSMDFLYNLCDKKRAELRKKLKALDKVVTPGDIYSDAEDVPQETIDSLTKEYEDKSKEIWSISNDSSSKQAEHNAAKEKHLSYQRSIRIFNEQKDQLEARKLELSVASDEEIAKVKVTMEEMTGAANAHGKKIIACKKKIESMDKAEKCPVSPDGKVECAKAQLKILNAEILKNTEARNKLDGEIQALSNTISLVQRDKKMLDGINENIAGVNKKLSEMGQDPGDPGEFVDNDSKLNKAKITALDKEKEAIGNKVNELKRRKYNFEAKQRVEQQQAEQMRAITETKNVLDKFEKLVPILSPNGIITVMLSNKINELCETLNKELAYFDMAIKIVVEPWSVFVKIPGKTKFIPSWQLSWSEKARYSAPIQAAAASSSGFGIIAIDEHGMDISIRPNLMRYLLSKDVQCMVLSTAAMFDSDGKVIKPSPLNIEGVKVFYVDEGCEEIV